MILLGNITLISFGLRRAADRGCEGGLMTSTQALTRSLILAILAHDDDRASRAVKLAEGFALTCTKKQIAAAKRMAVKLTKQ